MHITMAQRKDLQTRFKPGQSGNPKGRRPTPKEFVRGCMALTPKTLQRLEQIIKSGEDRDAIAASKVVLGYAVGLPKAQVELSGPGGTPVSLQVAESRILESLQGLATKESK